MDEKHEPQALGYATPRPASSRTAAITLGFSLLSAAPLSVSMAVMAAAGRSNGWTAGLIVFPFAVASTFLSVLSLMVAYIAYVNCDKPGLIKDGRITLAMTISLATLIFC